jgi:type I protein arginine methyltransferase
MYDLAAYAAMIAFKSRTSAYARGLDANIAPGSVVLDIGAGAGILSFLACRAGASKVYAVESGNIIQLAREMAADNGFSSRIEFVQGLTTEIVLPEKVDGIVCDIHGVLPVDGNSIVSILDARDRFLKPGGWILPARETMWAALACSPSLHDSLINAWDTEYGFDFGKARLKSVNSMRAVRLKPEDLLVTPQRWIVLEYKNLDGPSMKGDVSWLVERNATAHGVCMWYEAETDPASSFTNSPAASERYVYRHGFFPWPEAVELTAGDRATVSLRADFVNGDYVWSWNTTLISDSGQVKARYRQSTFIGATVSPERLHKRAAGFVPKPKSDLYIDSKLLELIGRGISLGEIASALLAEFPARFKDWNAALARAADLSETYSQ